MTYRNHDDDRRNFILWCVFVLILFVSGCVGFSWYRSGIQQEVWKREGVNLSQWEVFCGSHPVERVMR